MATKTTTYNTIQGKIISNTVTIIVVKTKINTLTNWYSENHKNYERFLNSKKLNTCLWITFSHIYVIFLKLWVLLWTRLGELHNKYLVSGLMKLFKKYLVYLLNIYINKINIQPVLLKKMLRC